ncbi:hypothetical protein GH733_012660 [Mirounga leonina]|nr:hypothetical protein GH733_012660 [Mirounga leonina]
MDLTVIGYLVTKAAFNSGKMDIVANNDPFVDLNCMVYKFQYNSTHDKLKSTVKAENGKLIKEKPMSIFQGAEYVVESTGVFITLEKAGANMKGRARKVIISAPSVNAPKFMMSMNHNFQPPCPAPTKVIFDNFGIVDGLMSTVHAITATQNTADGSSGKLWHNG